MCNAIRQKDIMVGGNIAQGSQRYVRAEKGVKGIKEVADVVSSRKREKDL